MTVPLVLVSARAMPVDRYRREVSTDSTPRIDYIEITERLGGEFYGYDRYSSLYSRVLEIEKRLKLDIGTSFYAAIRHSKYNVILSTSEKAAIPVAMFNSLLGRRHPHVLIGHHLSSEKKERLFRFWKLDQKLSHMICVCRAQADFAVKRLGYPESKVDFIFDKVDHRFFRPKREEPEDYILAVGQEQRDYKSLLKATAETGLKLVVVASSPWSTFSVKVNNPDAVTVLSHISFTKLRDLYARARIVVVPLYKVDYAAGANAVLEAMSMGKPLILTHTPGISDYVIDGETGLYSTAESSTELRDRILGLWHCPAEQKRLGANARQAVEEIMNLENYVSNVVRIVQNSLNQ